MLKHVLILLHANAEIIVWAANYFIIIVLNLQESVILFRSYMPLLQVAEYHAFEEMMRGRIPSSCNQLNNVLGIENCIFG